MKAESWKCEGMRFYFHGTNATEIGSFGTSQGIFVGSLGRALGYGNNILVLAVFPSVLKEYRGYPLSDVPPGEGDWYIPTDEKEGDTYSLLWLLSGDELYDLWMSMDFFSSNEDTVGAICKEHGIPYAEWKDL